jgi:hypothetical protein
MRGLLAPAAAAAAVGLLLGVLVPRPAEGAGQWVKFLFTPQAGYSSTCLSCGWHEGACVGQPPPGPALDFPASCTDTETVYFRSFGLKWWGSEEWFAWGTPFTVPGTTCKTTEVRMFDTSMNLLGTMQYVHTYKTHDADMMMYVTVDGRENEYVFAGMAKKPWEDGGIPDSEKENQVCYDRGLTTGVHLHEASANGASTFVLRDKGSCTGLVKYPCGPQSDYPIYHPQDWYNDWARQFCIGDADCDGFTDNDEDYIGTDDKDDCTDQPGDADAWPPDIYIDTEVNIFDVMELAPYLQGGYDNRVDLYVDGRINVFDTMTLLSYMGTQCS